MALVERDILIANSLDAVYDYAAAPENLPQWYVGIAGASGDGVWPQPGGQVQIAYQVMGVNLDMTATVLTHNPPYEFVFQMDGMITGTSRWVYQDEGGHTHLYVAFDYDLPGGVLGQIADRVADMTMQELRDLIAGMIDERMAPALQAAQPASYC